MIERVPYAAPYVYSPRGLSDVAARSRQLRDAIKRADAALVPQLAARIRQLFDEGTFPGFFGPGVTLVPVPGRAPLVPGALWVPDKIARALQAVGLAAEVWPTLKRRYAVPKSAWAAPGQRPEVQQHFDSFEVTDRVPPTEAIVLVDDFVTKGRTLIAAASRLAADLEGIEVRAFAVVRTMGLVLDIPRIREPVVGELVFENGDVSRTP